MLLLVLFFLCDSCLFDFKESSNRLVFSGDSRGNLSGDNREAAADLVVLVVFFFFVVFVCGVVVGLVAFVCGVAGCFFFFLFMFFFLDWIVPVGSLLSTFIAPW